MEGNASTGAMSTTITLRRLKQLIEARSQREYDANTATHKLKRMFNTIAKGRCGGDLVYPQRFLAQIKTSGLHGGRVSQSESGEVQIVQQKKQNVTTPQQAYCDILNENDNDKASQAIIQKLVDEHNQMLDTVNNHELNKQIEINLEDELNSINQAPNTVQLNTIFDDLLNKKEELELHNDELIKEISKLEQNIEAKNVIIAEHKKKEDKWTKIQKNFEKLASLTKQNIEIKQNNLDLKGEIDTLKKNFYNQNAELDASKSNFEKYKGEIKTEYKGKINLEQKGYREKIKKLEHNYKTKLQQYQTEVDDLSKKLGNGEYKQRQLESSNKTLLKKNIELQNTNKELSHELDMSKNLELKKIRENYQNNLKKIREGKNELLATDNESLQEQNKNLNNELLKVQNERDEFQSMLQALYDRDDFKHCIQTLSEMEKS